MIKYIFDVDGVLCDTGQFIDEEFKWFFENDNEDIEDKPSKNSLNP